jgi:hypothetical protein
MVYHIPHDNTGKCNLYGMHPVVCYLRKDIIWDSRPTNNQEETKQTLLFRHLFLFVFGGIATRFDPFSGSSSVIHGCYLISDHID